MSGGAFITEDFLLETDAARRLYHEYAADPPIIDYHCHLSPARIAADHRFSDLTELWLAEDHYKWRAMRAAGVAESYCTGDAPAREKFARWAETVPKLLRNPLYHWTHLELKRPFGISDRLLGPSTAPGIWTRCNELLGAAEFSCRGLLRQFNVALLCTVDDPVDDLQHHRALSADPDFPIVVLPTWRPDKALAIDRPVEFNAWIDALSAAADVDIATYDDYLRALRVRHDHFHRAGCRLSDHGLDAAYAEDFTASEVGRTFAAVRCGSVPSAAECRRFKSAMLVEFAAMDDERGWAQQYHLGAMRNCNTRMYACAGPDSGFDSIGDDPQVRPLARLLDRLDRMERLPRTILYHSHPGDSAAFATLAGSFADGSVPAKVQLGSAWWFLDQRDGITRQIEVLSQMGLLSAFVGITTDSRSFLSYSRHEYFRRLLCNVLGDDMARGLVPGDFALIGAMVRDICYNNARTYFGFGSLPPA